MSSRQFRRRDVSEHPTSSIISFSLRLSPVCFALMKAMDAAIKACVEYGVTPDQLAVALMRSGEELGRGQIWDRKSPRDEAYKKFVRTFPCAVTLDPSGIEAAHISELRRYGPSEKGTGKKVSDYKCIPLNHLVHRELHDGTRHIDDVLLACALASTDILEAYIKNIR